MNNIAGVERKNNGLRAFAFSGFVAAVLAVPVLGFFLFFRNYVIPTGSMEKTILVGDYIVAQIRDIGELHRREIVVFHYPPDPRQTHVKRIVAVPGDRLRIVAKQLYINGAAVQEPYVEHATKYLDSYRDNFPSKANTALYPGAVAMLQHNVSNGEILVPPGKYFVMGDNRDLSLDSRYFGFVGQKQIFGRPVFIYLSIDKPPDGVSRLRPERFLKRVE